MDPSEAEELVRRALTGDRATDAGLSFTGECALELAQDRRITESEAVAILTGTKALSGTLYAPRVS